jgi:ABC-type glycerol-3-phosphate transport system permease component
MAVSSIMSVPVLALVLASQRHVVRVLTDGAVKC